MGDAERLQIGHDRRGGVEAEIGGELEAVGRTRNSRRHDFGSQRWTPPAADNVMKVAVRRFVPRAA